jgi:hypothetical protein
MNDPIVVAFVGGLLTAGFAVAALFFLRFWTRTGDRLFLTFAGAFLLLAVNQAVPVLLGIPSEEQGYVYLLRLAGFALIILAILSKNLRRG